MMSIYLILIYSVFASSCDGQTDTNQNVGISPSRATYKDPLFFIEGQLCQHLRRTFQDKNETFGLELTMVYIAIMGIHLRTSLKKKV